VYAYVPNFVSIGLFYRPLLAKNPNFSVFLTSAFSGVANWQQSDKAEHGYTTTNLPLSNGINVVSVFAGAQSLTFKSETNKQTDKQTDKQTQNSSFLAAPARVGEIRAPPNLAW